MSAQMLSQFAQQQLFDRHYRYYRCCFLPPVVKICLIPFTANVCRIMDRWNGCKLAGVR